LGLEENCVRPPPVHSVSEPGVSLRLW
jgi:hypothetical protein